MSDPIDAKSEKYTDPWCRKCQYHAYEKEPYSCAFALITGRTRRAQPAGKGCTYRLEGDRLPLEGEAMKEPVQASSRMGRPPVIDRVRLKELWDQGLLDREISDEMKITIQSVRWVRRALNLPGNFRRKKEGSTVRAKKETENTQILKSSLRHEKQVTESLQNQVKTMRSEKKKGISTKKLADLITEITRRWPDAVLTEETKGVGYFSSLELKVIYTEDGECATVCLR